MMSSTKKYLCLLALASAGFLTQANAQHRGGDNRSGGGNFGGGSRSDNRSFGNSNGGGRSTERRDNNWGGGNRSADANRQVPSGGWNRSDNNSRRFDPGSSNRGGVTTNPDNNFNRQRTTPSNGGFGDRRSNPVISNNNRGFSNNRGFDNSRRFDNNRGFSNNRSFNNNRVGYSGRYYSNRSYGGYRGYAPRRYVYVGAPRYSILPRGYLSLNFGGYPYYYNSGLFYSYYDGYYSPVFAPIGIHISTLPLGYYPFYLGSSRYYYYSGVYYRDYDNGNYEVVDAPLGAQVSSLPKGATVAVVNGEKFYEFNGTYYREETNSHNEVVYTVVGKNGEINNSDDSSMDDQDQASAPVSSGLQVGDVVTELPEGTRPVTIDGQSLFVSPDNVFFKQVVSGNSVSYQVVGMSEGNN